MENEVPSPSPDNLLEEEQSRIASRAEAARAADEERARRIREEQEEQESERNERIEERIRHSHLADAQEDGERALRTTSDRLQRDIEDLENRAESTRVLNAELREIALESHDARIAREVDDSDELESAQHERKVSVQLAISLAEEERLRRITEDENERLASTAEELDERHANQRAASAAVEEERRRRLLENPLGSPFATPARHKELTTEELEAEHRRANSLLAEQVEKEERALMIHEHIDSDRLALLEEQMSRSLAQRLAVTSTDAERARRELELESAQLEESRERRHNVAAVLHAVEAEQNDRIARDQTERAQADIDTRIARSEAQIRAITLAEEERQDQIERHVRRTSVPTTIATH